MKSLPVVRQAVPGDLADIWRIRYAVQENTLTPGRLSDEDVLREIGSTGRGWVCEVEGVARAFAIGNAQNGNVWVLFVEPGFQGRGLGRALHDEMIGWFREQPVERLWLTTGKETRARQFYERAGWVLIGEAGEYEVRYERANKSRPVASER
jgi:GNAT superfamily N-acetyltransferase